MEKKRKLGRGLDEVANLWLSSSSIPSEDMDGLDGQPSPDNKGQDKTIGFTPKTFSVFYPESSKVKGLLVTNLTLELAKLGHGSCILDYEPNGSPLRSLLGNLFQNPSKGNNHEASTDLHQVIRLYGMPSIHLFSNTADNSSQLNAPLYSDNLYSQITGNNLQDSIIFLYHQDTLEVTTTMEDLPSNIILVSRPRKESLLISYAYIKTALRKNPHVRIWIIMDEVVDRDEAAKAFTLLSQIAIRRLSNINHHPLKFLGSIVHDQAFGICLATHFPLALSEESSLAKESLARIATNLLKLIDNPD